MENIVNSASAVASTPTVLRRLCTGVILSPVPSVIEENGLVMQNLLVKIRKKPFQSYKVTSLDRFQVNALGRYDVRYKIVANAWRSTPPFRRNVDPRTGKRPQTCYLTDRNGRNGRNVFGVACFPLTGVSGTSVSVRHKFCVTVRKNLSQAFKSVHVTDQATYQLAGPPELRWGNLKGMSA